MKTTKTKWNKLFLAAMAAVTLVFGLALAGCDDGNNDPSTGDATLSLADGTTGDAKVRLELSAGVWAVGADENIASWFIFDPADEAVTATASTNTYGIDVTFAKNGAYSGKVTINPAQLAVIKAKTLTAP